MLRNFFSRAFKSVQECENVKKTNHCYKKKKFKTKYSAKVPYNLGIFEGKNIKRS